MDIKLWTKGFKRLSLANLLIFIGVYTLFPVLGLEMAKKLDTSVANIGHLFLFFVLGMILVGPFKSYILDSFRRRHITVLSMLMLVCTTMLYNFVSSIPMLMAVAMIQGVAFNLAVTASITFTIDITYTDMRSRCNVSYSWMARLGMLLGITLGIMLYKILPFASVLYFSSALMSLSILLMLMVHIPFRAPINTPVCSSDRFFLWKGWLPGINLIVMAFSLGITIVLPHTFINCHCITSHLDLPLYAYMIIGYIIGKIISNQIKSTFAFLIVLGMLFIIVGFYACEFNMIVFGTFCLGTGFGIVLPHFLILFIKLSDHCQRVTANATHLLCAEIGVASGIYFTYAVGNTTEVIEYAQYSAVIALLLFVLITYPYFIKYKTRD